MAQETAVEWLIKNIPQRFANAFMNECIDVIEQAKQMEKEQIMNARLSTFDLLRRDDVLKAEQYYNETYKKE